MGDHSHLMEEIINLTLEIICLITGEDCTVVKKSSGEALRPIMGPQAPSLTLERRRYKKVLEVAKRIIELLTREVPIRCQDVAVYLSVEEREYLEGHGDQYQAAMMEDHPPLTSPDGSRSWNPSEKCPRLLYSQDFIPVSRQCNVALEPLSGGHEIQALEVSKPRNVAKEPDTEADLRERPIESFFSCGIPDIHMQTDVTGGPEVVAGDVGYRNEVHTIEVSNRVTVATVPDVVAGDTTEENHEVCFTKISGTSRPIFEENSEIKMAAGDRREETEEVIVGTGVVALPDAVAGGILKKDCEGNRETRTPQTVACDFVKEDRELHGVEETKAMNSLTAKQNDWAPARTESDNSSVLSFISFIIQANNQLNSSDKTQEDHEAQDHSAMNVPAAANPLGDDMTEQDEDPAGKAKNQDHVDVDHRTVDSDSELHLPESRVYMAPQTLDGGMMARGCKDPAVMPEDTINVVPSDVGRDYGKEVTRRKSVIVLPKTTGDNMTEKTEVRSAKVNYRIKTPPATGMVVSGKKPDEVVPSKVIKLRDMKITVQTMDDGNMEKNHELVASKVIRLGDMEVTVQTGGCGSVEKTYGEAASQLHNLMDVALIPEISDDNVGEILEVQTTETIGQNGGSESETHQTGLNTHQPETASTLVLPATLPRDPSAPNPSKDTNNISDSRERSQHVCQECGREFRFRSHMVVHCRTHAVVKSFTCSECGKSFANKTRLRAHQKYHSKEKPCSCSDCGKRFYNKTHLQIHQRIHKDERPFVCTQCGKTFNHHSNFVRHHLVHTGEKRFLCSYCGKSFAQSSHLTAHQKLHTRDKDFSCAKCRKKFPTEAALHVHHKFHRITLLTCNECGKCFVNRVSFTRHQRVHTGHKLLSCPECGKCFINKAHLVIHRRIHSGEKPFACPECGRRFSDKSAFDKHCRRHMTKTFKCSECSESFDKKRSLAVHRRTHRDQEMAMFFCSKCNKSFKTKPELQSHQEGHQKGHQKGHQEGHQKGHQEGHLEEEPLSCDDCGKCFNKKGSLKSHRRVHRKEKRFSCLQCNKAFRSKAELKTHQRNHIEERPFLCADCGRRFASEEALAVHRKRHVGKKKFTCSECGRGFNERSNFEKHCRIHTGEKPFSCSDCGRTFSVKSNLVRHLKTHTGERPFTCQECGKSFAVKSYFITHKKIHTGEREFTCSHCQKTFRDRSNYQRHKKIHLEEKRFTCPECGRSFRSPTQLTIHAKSHAPRQKFECSQCAKNFKNNWGLGKHMKTHTGKTIL